MNEETRKKIYDLLKQQGMTNSYDSFYKRFDEDENVRKDVYNRLSKEGLEDSYDDFKGYTMPSNPIVDKTVESVKTETNSTNVQPNESEVKHANNGNYKPAGKFDNFLHSLSTMFSSDDEPKEFVKDEAYNNRIAEIERRKQENAQKRVEKAKQRKFSGYGIGFIPDVDDEDRNLQAETRALDRTKKIIDAAARKGNTTYVGETFRGMADQLTDDDQWDFGYTSLKDANQVLKVKEKLERGEQITDSEKRLMESWALENDVNNAYHKDVNAMYTAGKTTAYMAPFMAEMAINPIAGATQAASKRLTASIGKGALNMVKKGAIKTATSMAGGAGMAVTSGALRSEANATNKEIGNVVYDENGNVTTEGGVDNKLLAHYKGYMEQAIEDATEMLGADIPVGELVGKGISKLSKSSNLGLRSIGKVLQGIKNNSREFTSALERVGWNGVIEEGLEEEIGILGNAIMPGLDGSFSDFADLEQQRDIWLGVSLFGGFTSTIASGMYAKRYRQAKKMLADKEEELKDVFDNREGDLDNLKQRIKDADENESLNILNSIMDSEQLTDNEKATLKAYIKQWKVLQGVTLANLNRADGSGQSQAEENAYDVGLKTEDPNAIHVASNGFNEASSELSSVAPDVKSQLDKFKEDGVAESIISDYISGLDSNVQKLANQYKKASVLIDGIRDGAEDRVDKSVNELKSKVRLAAVTEPDGTKNITTMTDKDGNVHYIQAVNENGLPMIEFDTESQKSISVDPSLVIDPATSQTLSYDEYIENFRNEEMKRAGLLVDNAINHNPRTELNPQSGTILYNGQQQYILRFDNDGTPWLDPYKTGNDGIPVDTSDDGHPTTMDEVIAMQDYYYDALDSANNVQNKPENVQNDPEIVQNPVELAPENPVNENEQPIAQEEENVSEENTTQMSVDEQGNELFTQAEPETTIDYIYNQNDFTEDEADAFVKNYKKSADDALDKIKKKQPTTPNVGESIAKYKKRKGEWQQQYDEAKASADYWKSVVDLRKKTKPNALEEEAKTVREGVLRLNEKQSPVSLNDFVMRSLASGEYKFIWDNDGTRKGLGNELGLSRSHEERRKRFAFIKNDGMSVEAAAESMANDFNSLGLGTEVDVNDVRNAIIDALTSYTTQREMLAASKELVDNYVPAATEDVDDAGRTQEDVEYEFMKAEAKERGFDSAEQYQGYLSYIENNILGNVTDEELADIFANYFEESDAAIQATEELNNDIQEQLAQQEYEREQQIDELGTELLQGNEPDNSQASAGSQEEQPIETTDGESGVNVPAQEVTFPEGSPEAANEERIAELESQIGDVEAELEQLTEHANNASNEDDAIIAEQAINEKQAERNNLAAELGGLQAANDTSREEMAVTKEKKKRTTKKAKRENKSVEPTADAGQTALANPSGNKLVTDERYAALVKRMKEKMRGQMNIGIDPEILAIGTEMAVYHIEKGSRKFAQYATAMIADLGDAIRPYLKAFYNGARDLPGMEELSKGMDDYSSVSTFDVANFDKQVADPIANAETRQKERKANEDSKKFEPAKMPSLFDMGFSFDGESESKPKPKAKEFSEPLSKEDVENTEVTDEEVELVRYHGNGYVYYSDRTGETITNNFSANGNTVYLRIEDKDGKFTNPSADIVYFTKYLKANSFNPVEGRPKNVKNKFGYWINEYGIVLNEDVITVPSSKKGHVNFNEVRYARFEDGKWGSSLSYMIGESGGSRAVSIKDSVYDTKSEAIKAIYDRLVRIINNSKYNERALKDAKNLEKHLREEVLPNLYKEDGLELSFENRYKENDSSTPVYHDPIHEANVNYPISKLNNSSADDFQNESFVYGYKAEKRPTDMQRKNGTGFTKVEDYEKAISELKDVMKKKTTDNPDGTRGAIAALEDGLKELNYELSNKHENKKAEPSHEQKVKATENRFRNLLKHNPHALNNNVPEDAYVGWGVPTVSDKESKAIWDRVVSEIKAQDLSKARYHYGDVIEYNGKQYVVDDISGDGKGRIYYSLTNPDGTGTFEFRGHVPQWRIAKQMKLVESSGLSKGAYEEIKDLEREIEGIDRKIASVPKGDLFSQEVIADLQEEKKQLQKEIEDIRKGEVEDENPEEPQKQKTKTEYSNLTEDEINNADAPQELKDGALAYINGITNFVNQIAYQNIYNNVRNRSGNSSENGTDANGTQLGTTTDGNRGLEQSGRGGSNGNPVDMRNSGEGVSGNDGTRNREHKQDGVQHMAAPAREGRNSDVRNGEGSKPVSGDSGSKQRKRGGSTRGNGHNVRGAGGNRVRKSDAAKDGGRRTETERQRDSIADEINDLLSQFEKAGHDGTLSISVIGLNAKQIEITGKLVVAGVKYGYTYIKDGLRKFEDWASKMKQVIGAPFQSVLNLTDAEVNELMTEMWEYPYTINGETKRLCDWAQEIGRDEVEKEVRKSFSNKREAQKAADNIDVKVKDIDNIRETLPYLLPQQQEDVFKAETQFFDESHADREHGFGKGYLFTNGTGTGKTYTGLGIIKRFIKQGKGRILVLTPSQQKVTDWSNDAKNLDIQLTPLTGIDDKGEGAVITTFANLRTNKELMRDDFDLIVYDESHRIMENKEAKETIGAYQHYLISNKNVNHTLDRMMMFHPLTERKELLRSMLERIHKTFDTTFDTRHYTSPLVDDEIKLINELKSLKYGGIQLSENDFKSTRIKELIKSPNVPEKVMYNGKMVPTIHQDVLQYEELVDAYVKKIRELQIENRKEIEDKRKEFTPEAEKKVANTKVVFLSATPFNVRESLGYAEGYIFSYPEENRATVGSYNHRSSKEEFFERTFGAGYRFRYGRLENHVENADALSRQEVEFSDYLQNNLQTMSGRIIDSEFDYSRDFPTLTLERSDDFNNALQDVMYMGDDAMKPMADAFYALFGDYNYSSALFESIKVSLAIPRIKEHIAKGRKIVLFHRRVATNGTIKFGGMPITVGMRPPFNTALQLVKFQIDNTSEGKDKDMLIAAKKAFETKYADLLSWEKGLDIRMPREQLVDAFGADNVLMFSGKETKAVKEKAVAAFNNDDSGKNIIIIQEASGKEGISLHDTTGKHQRVIVGLALPQSPITFIQIEGRIYRIGNKSNAIFEYPLLGIDLEMNLFAQKFNTAVGTTENLALGSKARGLRESIANGVIEHSGDVDINSQGLGGKEYDGTYSLTEDAFDKSISDYYGTKKLNGKRDQRDGMDYYPTPEPLGFKMVEWLQLSDGETAMEPSAGHGAIARYFPRGINLTAIEPSQKLMSELQLRAGGVGRKFIDDVFENHALVNKYDGIAMNPPFGTAGRMAVDHLAKAFNHLPEGGRLVALIPRGATDSKFQKWYDAQKNACMVGEIQLPDVTFERAGTTVRCRIVVIDRITRSGMQQRAFASARRIDLSQYDKIEDFFDALRDVNMPKRNIDQSAIMEKKIKKYAKELQENKLVKEVNLYDGGIIRVRTSLRMPSFNLNTLDESGEKSSELTFLNEYRIWRDQKTYNDNETDLKSIVIKAIESFSGMDSDQMDRRIAEYDAENKRIQEERSSRMRDAANEGNAMQAITDELNNTQSNSSSDVYKYKEGTHTKTGEAMHLAVPSSDNRMDKDTYNKFASIAKSLGGYWNKYAKGFHFKTKESAQQFLNQVNAQPSINEYEGTTNVTEEQHLATEAAIQLVSDVVPVERASSAMSDVIYNLTQQKPNSRLKLIGNITENRNVTHMYGPLPKGLANAAALETVEERAKAYGDFYAKHGTVKLSDFRVIDGNIVAKNSLGGDVYVEIGSPYTMKDGIANPYKLGVKKAVNGSMVPAKSDAMIVWHGSAADFDEFDTMNHLGEGEGGQAYGVGTYVSDVRGTAEMYADIALDNVDESNLDDHVYINGKEIRPTGDYEFLFNLVSDYEGDVHLALADAYDLHDKIKNNGFYFGNALKKQVPIAIEILSDENNEIEYKYEEVDRPSKVLYKVDIPHHTAAKYISWNETSVGRLEGIVDHIKSDNVDKNHLKFGIEHSYIKNFSDLYVRLASMSGGAKNASKILNEAGYTGIKVPTGNLRGGDGRGMNYVIFNDNDLTIKEKIPLLSTSKGTVYGWAVNGKVYLTEKGINPNTPIHEYTHLWARAVEVKNPTLWNDIINKLKATDYWNEVANDKAYRNIFGEGKARDSRIASEVLSRMTGRKGYALLNKMAEEALQDPTLDARVRKMSVIHKLKQALKEFWNYVANDIFHMKSFNTAEDIPMQVLSDLVNGTDILTGVESNQEQLSVVTDKETIDWFNRQPKVVTYKTVAIGKDGSLHAPMADNISSTSTTKNKIKTNNFEFGTLMVADEHPELVDEKGKISIIRDDGKVTKVAYDPYDHSSDSFMNDQFKSAWERDNLVVIRQEIAQADLDEAYHADKALLPTGMHEWKKGVVGNKLPKDQVRHVYLARYSRPIAQVDWNDVAKEWIDKCTKNNIDVPFNVVPKAIRDQISDAGVNIVAPESGMGKNCFDAYEEWKKSRTDKKGVNQKKMDDFDDILDYVEYIAKAHASGALPRAKRIKSIKDGRIRENTENALNYVESYVASNPTTKGIVVVNSLMTDDELAKELGVSKDDPILDEIKAMFVDSAGGNLRGYDKIVIIADNYVGDKELHDTLVHESIHALFDNSGDIVNTLWETFKDNKKYEWFINLLKEEYDEIEVPEEFCCYFITGRLLSGNIDEVRNGLDDNQNAQVTYILNSLGYDEQGKPISGGQRNAEAVQRNSSEGYKQQEKQGEKGKVKVNKKLVDVDGNTIFDNADPDLVVTFNEVGNAAQMYENRLQQATYKMQEAWQDSMLGLKTLQESVAKASGARILDFENAYMAENHMSSINIAEMDAYNEHVYKPLLAALNKLEKEGEEESTILDYMMAKHGLERNKVLANRDAKKAADEWLKNELTEIGKEHANTMRSLTQRLNHGSISQADYNTEVAKADAKKQNDVNKINADYPNKITTFYADNRERDYSGLTGLTGESDVAEAEMAAEQMVSDFENNHDVTELWDKTNAANTDIMQKQLESGLIDKDTFDELQNMFQNYIPLRGFDETTSDEVYTYLTTERAVMNKPLKSARGRKSKADNPIATIGNMAESGIMEGNRNMMKQRFLLMAENHHTDAIGLNEAWFWQNSVTGEFDFVPFPEIPNNATPAEIKQIMEDFEKQMSEASANNPDVVIKASDMKSKKMPYRVLKKNLGEHQVLVKRNGKDYVLTIMGNPRAAQAINGLTNPNASTNMLIQLVEKANRFMAANFTNRNPSFVLANLVRDGIYANSTVWVKENHSYAITYHKNWGKALSVLPQLIKLYNSGKLDMSNPMHVMFKEFILNGGETGYTFLKSVDDYKGIISDEMKKMNRSSYDIRNGIDFLDKSLGSFNRWAEGTSRFAAYMTSRNAGRSISRSINDAKEISVNFNKKGAGSKTLGKNSSNFDAFQALLAQFARGSYVFWNAGVQSLTNFLRIAKKNPIKFTMFAGTLFLSGHLMPVVNLLLASLFGGDDDDNKYFMLPEYVRRNNICIFAGDRYITIPLPIELRSMYGSGELVASAILKGMKGSDFVYKMTEQFAQILPIDPTEGDGGVSAFVPSYIKPYTEIMTNKDWTGLPIWKDDPNKKNMPEWTKAYKSTSPELIKLSEALNNATGGNPHKKGDLDKWILPFAETSIINPSVWEHLFEGYLGGVGTTINQAGKTMKMPFNEDLREWRNVPIVNRFLRSSDERAENKAITNQYYELNDKFKVFEDEYNAFKRDAEDPKIDAQERIMAIQKVRELSNTPEYDKYVVWKELNKTLKAMRDEGLSDEPEYLERMKAMIELANEQESEDK